MNIENQQLDEDLIETNKNRSFTDQELFTKIWTEPRAVLKYIHENKIDDYIVVLLILTGITRALNRAIVKEMGDDLSLLAILGISVIFGALFGWISYYIYSAMISWTGKWIDGKADTESILRILAYAMIPSVLSLIFIAPQIGVYGIELFKSDGDLIRAGIGENILFYGALFMQMVLGLFSLVFCVIGISEVQNFSIGQAVLNLLLPILVIMIPLLFFII